MAVDKVLQRIEAKLDALLEANGIDLAEFGDAYVKAAARPPRELTPAEQQAIDNAPKHIEAKVVGATPPQATPTPEQTPDLRKATEDEAKAAGLTGVEAQTAEVTTGVPWHGYDDASSEDIIQRLRSMDANARERALAYERRNKNRVTIMRVGWNT